MNLFTKIGICCLTLGSFVSCEKESDFPKEPVLKFRSFERVDRNTAIWKIGFTDGDGDVGTRNQSEPENFIVDIWFIEEGVASLDTNLTAENYRVPVVKGVRTAAGVEGEIEFKISGLDLIRAEGYDSIYYSGYLIDRSENESNVVRTPEFSTN